MIFSKKPPINFDILKCYTNNNFIGTSDSIDFLKNKSFFTTIERLKNYPFKIKTGSAKYVGALRRGIITITCYDCEMEIRFDKYSYLIKEYVEEEQQSVKMSKIEVKLLSQIKKRIDVIYEALFENY